MSAKKTTELNVKNVEVKDFNIPEIAGIVKDLETTPIENCIGACIILKQVIKQLSGYCDKLEDKIISTPLSDICKDFMDRGLIEDGEFPNIVIGEHFNVNISESVHYSVNTAPIKSLMLDKEVKEKYGKTEWSPIAAAIKKDYADGSLPAILKPYISSERKTSIVGTDLTDEVRPKVR